MFFVVISLDCFLLPTAVMSWRLWDITPCECEIPGCWLATDDESYCVLRRLEIPTKTVMLRAASILGKEQDSYLKLCRLFHKLTCNSRCYYLDQPGYYEKKMLGISQHRRPLEVWQESNWLFTCCISTALVKAYLKHCQHEPTSWCLRKRICCFNALSRG